MDRSLATKERPLLNQGLPYIPDAGRTKEDDIPMIWDADKTIRKRTHITQNEFDRIYHSVLRYFAEQEKYQYRQYQTGEKPAFEFYRDCTSYLRRTFPAMNNENDYNIMMERINLAVFGYDVIQPLIDNKDTTDITICGPHDIRVRVKGKAYKSNAEFLDNIDLTRFVESIALRNGLDMSAKSDNTIVIFTDLSAEEYILRFVVSYPIVNMYDYPYLHIRKINKKKKNYDNLIAEGMLNEDVKLYLIDRAKTSKGIVFAGPPGSGKTVALNAFIEYIPKTRESVVLQESDELHTEQSGFIFKHVTHGFSGEPIVTLEELARVALVEGCNEFIIGEVKGGEMRYAMTLLNSGGHIALTAHSNNAYETLNKLADLVKYGSDYSYDEARRMLKNMDTIVYMEGYKVREILECTGYNDETKQFEYTYIYRYDGKEAA